MKTRTISNQYGSVVIIDDVKEAEKVLAELKEKTAVDAAIARKAGHHNSKKATFVPEEKVPGKKANRAARRTARRAAKRMAKRVKYAFELLYEAETEEIKVCAVHDDEFDEIPPVYPAGMIDEGTGISSPLQRKYCKELYGSANDALFLVPGTKTRYFYLGRYVEESEIPDDVIVLPEFPNDRILEPEDFNKIILESNIRDERIWASEIRMSKLSDKPDFVLLDDGLHKWYDLSSDLHDELNTVTKDNKRDFFLDAVCFTTVDGSEVKVLFYSKTLHTIATLQEHVLWSTGLVEVNYRIYTVTEKYIVWLMLNAKKASTHRCNYDYNDACELAGQFIFNIDLKDGVTVPFEEYFFSPMLSEGIQPYHYKPEPIFYGTDPLFFGQEFEFEFETFSNLEEFLEDLEVLSDFVYFKEDGSLMGPSVEVVTHPCSFEVAASLCRDITQTAIKHEATTTHCGHHVHVSRNAFSENEVKLMVKTVHDLWDKVISFSGRTEDETQRFCADSFIRYCGRYAAVNTENATTVEIRIMKAKLNVNEASDNLTFVKMLGDSVKKDNSISLQSWLRARAVAKENVKNFSFIPWSNLQVSKG